MIFFLIFTEKRQTDSQTNSWTSRQADRWTVKDRLTDGQIVVQAVRWTLVQAG